LFHCSGAWRTRDAGAARSEVVLESSQRAQEMRTLRELQYGEKDGSAAASCATQLSVLLPSVNGT